MLLIGRGQKPYAINELRWYQAEHTFTRDSASVLFKVGIYKMQNSEELSEPAALNSSFQYFVC